MSTWLVWHWSYCSEVTISFLVSLEGYEHRQSKMCASLVIAAQHLIWDQERWPLSTCIESGQVSVLLVCAMSEVWGTLCVLGKDMWTDGLSFEVLHQDRQGNLCTRFCHMDTHRSCCHGLSPACMLIIASSYDRLMKGVCTGDTVRAEDRSKSGW